MRRHIHRRIALGVLISAAWAVAGCGPIDFHVVTGTFGDAKPIGLAYYVPGNATFAFYIQAHADVPVGTTAVFRLTGPQQWTCDVVFAPSKDAGGSGDARQDKLFALPVFAFALSGPNGSWTMTINIPAFAATFSHTYDLGDGGQPADRLYQLDPRCSQVALSVAQQQTFVARYLTELTDREILALARVSGGAALKVERWLDQAKSAKTAGDAEASADRRAAFYETAAGNLTAIADFVSAMPRLASTDAARISAYAKDAAALLLQTGLD